MTVTSPIVGNSLSLTAGVEVEEVQKGSLAAEVELEVVQGGNLAVGVELEEGQLDAGVELQMGSLVAAEVEAAHNSLLSVALFGSHIGGCRPRFATSPEGRCP